MKKPRIPESRCIACNHVGSLSQVDAQLWCLDCMTMQETYVFTEVSKGVLSEGWFRHPDENRYYVTVEISGDTKLFPVDQHRPNDAFFEVATYVQDNWCRVPEAGLLAVSVHYEYKEDDTDCGDETIIFRN